MKPAIAIPVLLTLQLATAALAQEPSKGSILDRLDKLEQENLDLRLALSKAFIPSDVPCSDMPGRWESVAAARGMFLLGEGDGYTAGDEGGKAKVELGIEEMPSHSHGSTGALSGRMLPSIAQETSYPVPTPSRIPNNEYDWSDGKGEPHENMPPYRVVYFCRMK